MTKELIRFSPFGSLFPTDLWKDFFDDAFTDSSLALTTFPKGDVFYEKNKTVIELYLAGYSRDQLNIEVKEEQLVISASKREITNRSSMAARAFTKTFWIGNKYDIEKIDAEFKDGLLTIVLPLPESEIPKTKQIEIR